MCVCVCVCVCVCDPQTNCFAVSEVFRVTGYIYVCENRFYMSCFFSIGSVGHK